MTRSILEQGTEIRMEITVRLGQNWAPMVGQFSTPINIYRTAAVTLPQTSLSPSILGIILKPAGLPKSSAQNQCVTTRAQKCRENKR